MTIEGSGEILRNVDSSVRISSVTILFTQSETAKISAKGREILDYESREL
jgi:hypothetical protein